MKQLGDHMQQYFGYVACFFIGMLISDIIWMNKFGVFTIWQARWKSWRARKSSK